MKKILAFAGSPRKNGNSTIMLNFFKNGLSSEYHYEEINPYKLNIKPCTGCLRCNVLKKCSIRDDDWQSLHEKIVEAEVIVFASPVYFHHLPAPLKLILDKFRSFVKVQIIDEGLLHTPHFEWNKKFILLLSMGASDRSEIKPIEELFNFLISILGKNNSLEIILAHRLAVSSQILKTKDELEILYEKMNLSEQLVENDFFNNQKILEKCSNLSEKI